MKCSHNKTIERKNGHWTDTLYRCKPIIAQVCLDCGKIMKEWYVGLVEEKPVTESVQ